MSETWRNSTKYVQSYADIQNMAKKSKKQNMYWLVGFCILWTLIAQHLATIYAVFFLAYIYILHPNVCTHINKKLNKNQVSIMSHLASINPENLATT